jgi:hypothetical protein
MAAHVMNKFRMPSHEERCGYRANVTGVTDVEISRVCNIYVLCLAVINLVRAIVAEIK